MGKNKNGANEGGEHQETTSATSSLTDCPSDNTAEDKSVQNQPNESETSVAVYQPSASGKEKNFDFQAALQHWMTSKQRKLFLSSSESK